MNYTGNEPENGGEGYSPDLIHLPVMLAEVLEYLDPQPGKIIVDCTLGGGGHALEICKRLGTTGRLIGIEQDDQALARAKEKLAQFPVTYIHDNFKDLENIINDLSVAKVDGFLFDLGVSSFQLDSLERGFSFRGDVPLDMRMDRRMPETAADLINRMEEDELDLLFLESGYGRWARRLAKAITATRKHSPILTTAQFTAIITATIPNAAITKIHPATQAYQAMRIAVNDELAALGKAVIEATNLSNTAARIIVISYHSSEDGLTKKLFKNLSGKRTPPTNNFERMAPEPPRLVNILTKKPLTPSIEEIRRNPRCRSAKLRAVERIITE